MTGVPVVYQSIGMIHSEHTIAQQTPIQPVFAQNSRGWVEVFPDYVDGLRDVEGFSHIYLIYHFHQAGVSNLTVKPFMQDREHGIFATRAPARPNAIGLSVVELVKREVNRLLVEGLDVLDGTPLLDVKPYTARFDHITSTSNGWQDEVDDEAAQQHGQRGYQGGHS